VSLHRWLASQGLNILVCKWEQFFLLPGIKKIVQNVWPGTGQSVHKGLLLPIVRMLFQTQLVSFPKDAALAHSPVVLATPEAEARAWEFEVSLGKCSETTLKVDK
jgi:hypothetical protein